MNPLDQLDPRAYLEQFIVDCTCDWCGKTYPPTWDDKKSWVQIVVQEWRPWVQKKTGYTLKTYAYWRVCAGCRLGDEYGFSKWVFPIIKNMGLQDLVSQLVQVQPMQVPAGEILYMDYVHGPARRPAHRPVVERPPHDDLADAFLGALGITAREMEREGTPIAPRTWKAFAQSLPRRGAVRGRRAEAVMIDDGNWRLDPDVRLDDVKVDGNEITIDASIIPPPTPERIEVNFTVNADGVTINDPGEPDLR